MARLRAGCGKPARDTWPSIDRPPKEGPFRGLAGKLGVSSSLLNVRLGGRGAGGDKYRSSLVATCIAVGTPRTLGPATKAATVPPIGLEPITIGLRFSLASREQDCGRANLERLI